MKSYLCDYSDEFISFTEDFAPFSTSKTETNHISTDELNHLYIVMPMYNLIEYGDNYSGVSGLWQFMAL